MSRHKHSKKSKKKSSYKKSSKKSQSQNSKGPSQAACMRCSHAAKKGKKLQRLVQVLFDQKKGTSIKKLKNGRLMKKGFCSKCGCKISVFF